ncbi:MAG: acetylornithine transaminase [Chloroflexi bacterium]|nr:acetylornithine transaminase [Chloroflexota bacterium]MCL5075912.1 acetylornithine transaminase [Chloroflexota bacterium]
MADWMALEKKYYMGTFVRLPVVLVRGQGTRVWDEQGRQYLDMVAGIAVNLLGHCHPAIVEAVQKQVQQLIHTSNLYYTIPQLELAACLVEHSCGDKVFFANSGAEANEGAIKLARKYGKLHRNGAYEIISATNSFHGRTLATIAATGQPKFQTPFTPLPSGFKIVPYNDLGALREATTAQTCAILLEVVQGESGVHLADGDYLRGVRAWCDENGLLLMLDEIQTGLGRTGRFLAYEHYGIEPDVFTLAKGLAGGVPIGSVVAKEAAACFTPSDHGSTFGGNPLACAAGLATINTILKEGLTARAVPLGDHLLSGLQRLQERFPRISAVRGLGLMAAFDLEQDLAERVVREALERGLILNATGPRTIRLVPPLIVTEAEINEALQILMDVLHSLEEHSDEHRRREDVTA